MKIENNVIAISDLLLQISNISQVSIEPMPKKKVNVMSALVFLLGVFAIVQRTENFMLLGTILITFGGVYWLWLCIENSRGGQYLYLYMNSGSNYYIFCENDVFLKEVINVIEYCINNKYIQEIKVDFENCQLDNSPLIIGNRNQVNQ